MGLTTHSTGIHAADKALSLRGLEGKARIIALAGNPNVGKSTVFNALTGMKQHTGNWPGKTVSNARGLCRHHQKEYLLVDIPGTYSLMAHSAEEEVARDFLCFGNPDATVVVCDATCLERNLNLVLQILEITRRVVLCVNLMDEAKKKRIRIDCEKLSENLGIPVVAVTARKGKGLDALMDAVEAVCDCKTICEPPTIRYLPEIERAIRQVEEAIGDLDLKGLNRRFVALKLLEGEETLIQSLCLHFGFDSAEGSRLEAPIAKAKEILQSEGVDRNRLTDHLVSCLVLHAEEVCGDAVFFEEADYSRRDRKIDRILTGRWTGFPVMILLLAFVFWLTVVGANLPSQLLANGLFWVQDRLTEFCHHLNVPSWIHGSLVLGVYRVLAWVVSVMLPPMAIFFPLFTLLEDLGYLPRIAFNLDKYFQKAGSCGKQALTLCMGFGCNAAGVVGCRIIDSPRERLIAALTNSFVPCNGRFPTLIALITMFFTLGVTRNPTIQSVVATLLLTGVILLGILTTFLTSRLLSRTLLKGVPSSFALELPPYRKPQIGRVLIRSIFDRTLFVLGRAAVVAAPAGLLIWLLANVTVGDTSLLGYLSDFFDPLGRLLGMDGVILLAFILAFPANEILLPIILMTYMATDTLTDYTSLAALRELLVDHGWSWVTALCTMLFSLMHWPCSTTCMTIRKETGSFKWTAASVLLPTVIGGLLCFGVATLARVFGWG